MRASSIAKLSSQKERSACCTTNVRRSSFVRKNVRVAVGALQRFQKKNVKGKIKKYNPAKGWGFIVCEEYDGDIFLHSKHISNGSPREYIGHFQSTQDGHQVKFDLDLQRCGRPQALNVKLMTDTAVPQVQKSRASSQRRKKRGGDVNGVSPDEQPEIDADPLVSTSKRCIPPPQEIDSSTPPPGLLPRHRSGLRLRGVPFSATKGDIAKFFDGYGVNTTHVTISTRTNGSSAGEAFVQFAREEIAQRAMREKNHHVIGDRYIELFSSNIDDTERMQDTKPNSNGYATTPPRHSVGDTITEAVSQIPFRQNAANQQMGCGSQSAQQAYYFYALQQTYAQNVQQLQQHIHQQVQHLHHVHYHLQQLMLNNPMMINNNYAQWAQGANQTYDTATGNTDLYSPLGEGVEGLQPAPRFGQDAPSGPEKIDQI